MPNLPQKVPFRAEHTGDVGLDRSQRMAQQVGAAHEQTKAVVANLSTRATAVEALAGPNPRWQAAANGANLAVTAAAGNFTTGVQFNVGSPASCVGLRFYMPTAGGGTVKVSLWDNAGTRLQTATVTVASSGVYLVALPATVLTPFALYRVTVYQTDGLNYYAYVAAAANAPARPFYAGGVVTLNNIALFLAGDSAPTTTAGTEAYAIDPVLV